MFLVFNDFFSLCGPRLQFQNTENAANGASTSPDIIVTNWQYTLQDLQGWGWKLKHMVERKGDVGIAIDTKTPTTNSW